jgi:hypothetical protein
MPRSLAVALLAALVGCASWFTTQLGETSTLEGALRVYASSKEKKAMAVAADERGRRTWGVLYGSYTQEHANEKAIEACEKNARHSGIQAPCHLFAEGDAPAPSTVRACRAGTIGARRCELQNRFFELYPR